MGIEKTYADMASAIRVLAADGVENAGSGHPGMPMGMADVATILFRNHLKFVACDLEWQDRDRFVLSAGHGSVLLYALLYLTGSPEMTLEQIKSLRQWGSLTPGHPEYRHTKGVDMTTGPLGQGIASAVGMALAECKARESLGEDAIDHHTYVIAGDGCLMEGVSHEAASLAGHLELSNLIVLFDDNNITIDGKTDISRSENIADRYKSYGWHIQEIDGHDYAQIDNAIIVAKASDKPSLICCRTLIGFGAPTLSGTSKIHGSPLGFDEIAEFKASIGWKNEPFYIPNSVLKTWREVGRKINPACEIEEQSVTVDWSKQVFNFKCNALEAGAPQASRVSSQKFLELVVPETSALIGGSADLSGSNGTRTQAHKDIVPGDYSGNYIRYGVREHAMAAIMNGMALHKPYIPYGGTFLVFSDYCRPAMRLSSLMKLNVIYVMTHDSIGLGADGPTHQPVEHIESLRLIPNLNVYRPCDAIETAECWELAAQSYDTPSVLVLSRQNLPLLRTAQPNLGENKCRAGGYILSDCEEPPQVTVFATGSEVSLAVSVAMRLKETGIACRVISVPCRDIVCAGPKADVNTLAGEGSLRVSIEAGSTSGWAQFVGDQGLSFGIDVFGASAPGPKMFEEYGLTSERIFSEISNRLSK